MLTIVGRKKKRARSTEGSFEAAFANAMLPRRSFHISSDERGWPDRYFGQGVWVEFKVLDGWADQLTPEQRGRMTLLEAAGDQVFYCALVPADHTVIFENWFEVKGQNLKTIERFAYRDKRDLKEIFSHAVQDRQLCHDREPGNPSSDG